MSVALGYRSATRDEVAGTLDLAVLQRGGRSSATRTAGSGVLRLLRPLYLDDSGQVTFIIVNPGGSYFGERYRIDAEVGPGANLLLTNQGATRIHRTPGDPAVQDATFVLHAGARLEYMPDQTIAYRDADYRQRIRVLIAPDAQCFLGEIVTPGWDPADIPFTYTGMSLAVDVCHGDSDGRVLTDTVWLRPARIGTAIDGIGYFEGASHLGSVIVIGPHTAGSYVDGVRERVEASTTVEAGVTSGTRHGIAWVAVRALARSTDDLSRLILDINEFDRSCTTGQGRMDRRRY